MPARPAGMDDKRILEALGRATPLGPTAVLAAAAPLLAEAAGLGAATFVVFTGTAWRTAVAGGPDVAEAVLQIPAEAAAWTEIRPVPDAPLTFVPFRPGSIGLVLFGELDPPGETAIAVEAVVTAAQLVLSDSERIRDLEDVLAELHAQQNLAIEILSVREVDQVLLSISRRALALLDADMAGVLLTEGEDLVMRSCVGHRSTRTAKLRMRAGQGLAGRVLETGEPTRVDNYLDSASISHDFDVLAHLEDTRSALGAPLQAHGRTIGVLEVWRRRAADPSLDATTTFTDRHVRRIVALANLATIAIENARLNHAQQDALGQLATAQESLARQVQTLSQASEMQRELTGQLLAGEGMPTMVRMIAERLGGGVAVLSDDFVPLAHAPRSFDAAALAATVFRRAGSLDAGSGQALSVAVEGGWLTVQAVQAGRDRLGWLCRLAAEPLPPGMELAFGEAVLSCALSQLESRASEQARAETRDEILIDLLDRGDERRQAAVHRAQRMHVDLSRPQRVLRGRLDRFDLVAETEGWDHDQVERRRREVRAMAQRVVAAQANGELVSLRGDTLMALVPLASVDDLEGLTAALDKDLARIVPGVRAYWGASSAQASPAGYGRADGEAQVALRAARRLGGESLAVYEQLGVVRLLLASEGEADLGDFVAEVIGPLVAHDAKHDGALLATLRGYFDCDCSQQKAAQRLFVHHKTMRYRLERISALTGLDLHRHEDRLRADLALRIHEVALGDRSGDHPAG